MTRRIKHKKTAIENTPSVAYSDWNAYLVDESLAEIDLNVFSSGVAFGSVANGLQISSGGFLTLTGTAECYLTMRPAIYAGAVAGAGKPTSVNIGIHSGYSCPISNGADGEVLYFRDYVPGRWDGTTDPVVSVICAMDTANTAGEEFAFTLEWDNNVPTAGAVSATNKATVVTQTELTTGHTAQYSIFKVQFVVDASSGPATALASGDHLAFKLYRTAVTGVGSDECEGEIVVLDVELTYKVDKMYKAT